MNRNARFWDKRAERYEQRPVADQETYEKKLGITRNYLTQDSEVLEIGCGTGSTAIAHAPYAKSILATDVSPAMIEIARAAKDDGVEYKEAPYTMPVRRLDDVKAARELDLRHDPA